jgi:predicted RNase H-like HicB family nuclease
MKYRVVIKKSSDGYAVWVPGLPGCASQGTTEAEALENIQTAIKEYLSVVDKIARRHKRSRLVEVAAV